MGTSDQNGSHPTRPELLDFNLGRLGDEAAQALGEHLEHCEECRRTLRELPDDPFLARLKEAADTEQINRAEVPLPQLRDYRIIRELGRGGMGVVYEAEQLSLKRRVAVKVLALQHNTDNALMRFRRESRLAARLHHTNVVPVFEVGYEGDVWFYVMQLIPGRSLDRVLAQLRHASLYKDTAQGAGQSAVQTATREAAQAGGSAECESGPLGSTLLPVPTPALLERASAELPTRKSGRVPGQTAHQGLDSQDVARIGMQVAEAVAHAHARGILHRDIKPSNLLLDDRGTVWVTDFGLAKAENDDLTASGAVLGTLRYMAPERFGGLCDSRADVYSIGCTLYELLVVRPAFNASGTAEVIQQILERVPTKLRSINPAIPRDLETIVHKAMERHPDQRYQSAQELADDLRRFRSGLPTLARPPGPLEHLVRWAHRNKGLAIALGVIVCLVLTGLVGLGVAVARFSDQAEAQHKLAGEKETQRAKAVEASEKAQKALIDQYASHGLMAGERGDTPYAMLWFSNAARMARQDPDRARMTRLRADAWAREVTLPVRAFEHNGEDLRQMSFRPGTGDLLLTVTKSGRLRVWDWANEMPLPWAEGRQTVESVCWSPNDRWLAVGLTDVVQIREIPSGKVLHSVPQTGTVHAVAFTPDGIYLATSDVGLQIWDCKKQDFTGPRWVPPDGYIQSLTFDTQGRRLAASVVNQGQVLMFSVTKEGKRGDNAPYALPHRQHWYEPTRHDLVGARVAIPPIFINDGRTVVTITDWGKVSLWDTETAKPTSAGTFPNEIVYVNDLVASPDGQTFAVAGEDGAYGLWSATSKSSDLKPVFHPHTNRVAALAFSPDGSELLTVSADRSARLSSVPSGQPIGHPLPHQEIVHNAAYSPDGVHLATGQQHGLVRIWRRPVPDASDRTTLIPHSLARLTPDQNGRYVIFGKFGSEHRPGFDVGETLGVYQTNSGTPLGPATGYRVGAGCVDAAVSPDGQSAAAVANTNRAGTLHLWNPRTGSQVVNPVPLPAEAASVAFNADGTRVGVLCDDGTVVLFDAQKGSEQSRFRLKDWRRGQGEILFLAFVPQIEHGQACNKLVIAHPDGSVHVCDENGTAKYPPLCGPVGSTATLLRFSRDGRRLAVVWFGEKSAAHYAVQIFDLSSGTAVSKLLVHPDTVFDVCFTHDGSRVFTGCRDHQSRLWDWEAGHLVCSCMNSDEVYGVAVTPDGLCGLTSCRKGNKFKTGAIHFWEFTTGKPAAPTVHINEGTAHSIVVSQDGTRALVGVVGNGLRSIDLTRLATPDSMALDDLCTLSELAAGQRLVDGDVSGLASDEWFALWRAFRQRQPTYGTPAFRVTQP
jgi:serine/threonine protein kinase/WD40 repeat protein